jgi:hypothetical protein
MSPFLTFCSCHCDRATIFTCAGSAVFPPASYVAQDNGNGRKRMEGCQEVLASGEADAIVDQDIFLYSTGLVQHQ